MHILSLEDDSHNHIKIDTLYKEKQAFHRLSASILLRVKKLNPFGQMNLNATCMLNLLILSPMTQLNKPHKHQLHHIQ